MSEVEMMIAEARDAIENKCDCRDGSCNTCHAIKLLYRSLELIKEEKKN